MNRWIFLLLSFVLFAAFVVKFALSFLVASPRVLPSPDSRSRRGLGRLRARFCALSTARFVP
jgi:hypothetical protein